MRYLRSFVLTVVFLLGSCKSVPIAPGILDPKLVTDEVVKGQKEVWVHDFCSRCPHSYHFVGQASVGDVKWTKQDGYIPPSSFPAKVKELVKSNDGGVVVEVRTADGKKRTFLGFRSGGFDMLSTESIYISAVRFREMLESEKSYLESIPF